MISTTNYCDIFHGYRFAWYGQRALDSVGLDRFLDLDLIMCCDYGTDTEIMIQEQHSKVFSVENTTYERENWTSALLDRVLAKCESDVEAYLAKLDRPVYVVAYSATKSLARFAARHPDLLRPIMPDVSLKEWLDNKFRFHEALATLGLPKIVSRVVELNSLAFIESKNEFGTPFVLHLVVGSSGSGTFFINTESDFEQVRQALGKSIVLISRYIDGVSLNVNAAVLGGEVIVEAPSMQLIGFEECSTRREVYCGNDFSAARELPPFLLARAREQVVVIGRWLATLGYVGMFGMDLIVDLLANEVYPIDLNPRFQNSTHLLTQLEILRGQVPLSVMSIAWQLRLVGSDDLKLWQDSVAPLLDGAQIIIHSLETQRAIVLGDLSPGTYPVKFGSPYIRQAQAISLLDRPAEDEVVVSCAIPRYGTIVTPGAPLCKVYSPRRVLDSSSYRLQPWARQICRSLYEQLLLSSRESETKRIAIQ